ncbi:MAG: SEC-C metal-binding domain-containing protein [Acidimicrobiia bacterium]
MTLDKRTLSSIDRKISATLDGNERFRMVRVPIDDRRWSIWNRHCQTVGISMGRGIALLIEQELATVATGTRHEIARDPISTEAENLAAQQAAVAAMQERLALEATRLQQWERQLEYRRDELHRKELRLRSQTAPEPTTPQSRSVGRNEPCYCGSGAKYKRCHGR